MEANRINFISNSNNKLNNKYFTSIRLSSKYVHLVGAIFGIYCVGLFRKKAILIRAKSYNINFLDDCFIATDSGLERDEFLKVMSDFYPHVDINDAIFYQLLFKSID